jgi:transposase
MASKRSDLYAAIRRDHRAGLGKRALMRKYGVGHPTVQKALESAWPQPRKKLPPRATRLDPFKSLVDDMLRADLDAPRKQRHTAKRVFDRLIDEHHADGISYGIVRAYVAVRRGEIRAEAGRGSAEVFVPQSHHPGQEAEVDFGDVTVHLAGQTLVCSLFSLRLSYSGKAVHRVFATSGQEAFLEGHVHAFSVLGGVPRGKVRYDNLKAAVAKVIGFARERKESARWLAFREHYGVDSFYCRPGLVGAHEKGGVEGDIGRFRRNHFVPVPEVGSLAELNTLVERGDEEDEARRIRMQPRTVGEYFAVEQPLLTPLPTEPFDAGQVIETRVDRHSRVWARAGFYSVPATSSAGSASCCTPTSWPSTTVPPRSPATSGWSPRPESVSNSTTTWRRCCASRAPCPGRPRWNRPARRASSPRSTTRGGPLPARPTGTRLARRL